MILGFPASLPIGLTLVGTSLTYQTSFVIAIWFSSYTILPSSLVSKIVPIYGNEYTLSEEIVISLFSLSSVVSFSIRALYSTVNLKLDTLLYILNATI